MRCALAIFACFTGGLWAAPLPPAPADGIRDNAHALEEPVHARLAQEVRAFEEELPIQFWLCAVTFVPDSQSLRPYARELRQGWSGGGDAVLLAYDRVSDSQALSFSPALWQRYPSASLIMLMQEGARIMAAKDMPLDQRLERSARLTMDHLRVMEREQRQMSRTLPPSHQRLAKICAVLLAAGVLMVLFIGSAARRRDAKSRWRLLFPEVQVTPRFGAPYGGGVSVTRSSGT